MRHLLVCGLVLVAGLAQAQGQKEDKYENKTGKYKVSFPEKPEITENKADSPLGKLTFTMAMWEGKGGDKLLMVSFVDYPVEEKDFDVQKGLDGGVDGAIKNPDAKLVGKVEKLDWGKDKLPGRKFVVNNTKIGIWGTNMMVIKGTRMYHLMVIGKDKDYATGKDAERFLESFEITK